MHEGCFCSNILLFPFSCQQNEKPLGHSASRSSNISKVWKSVSLSMFVYLIVRERRGERMRTGELSNGSVPEIPAVLTLISHFYSVSIAETLRLYQAQEMDGLNILYSLEAGK